MVAGAWLLPVTGAAAVFAINEWRPDVPSCDEYNIVPQFLLAFALPSGLFITATISLTHWRVHREVSSAAGRGAGRGKGDGRGVGVGVAAPPHLSARVT